MPFIDQRHELVLLHKIHLVDHDNHLRHRRLVVRHALHSVEEGLILVGCLDSVGEIKQHVCILKSALRERKHRLVELAHRLQHARSVAIYDLHVIGIDNAHDAMASCLGLRCDD